MLYSLINVSLAIIFISNNNKTLNKFIDKFNQIFRAFILLSLIFF